MTRLIDADAVLPWYMEAFKGEIERKEKRFSMLDIDGNLDNIPTVDAVPVVRCKDCDWWSPFKGRVQGHCILHEISPVAGWYCASGKRRETSE